MENLFMEIVCPNCKGMGQLDDNFAGQEVNCPVCGHDFVCSEKLFDFTSNSVKTEKNNNVESKKNVKKQNDKIMKKESEFMLETVFYILSAFSGMGALAGVIAIIVSLNKQQTSSITISFATTFFCVMSIFLCLGVAELVKHFRLLCKNISELNKQP